MSQSQSGRAAAQARRQAQLGGASTSPTASSSQPSPRQAAKQAPAPAPIPSRAEQRVHKAAPVAPAAPMASSRQRVQVISQPIAVAEGREAAKQRRSSQMKGNRGANKYAPQKASNNLHPKAKAYQNRVNSESVKAAAVQVPEKASVSATTTQFLAVSATKKDNAVTGKPVVVADGRNAAQKRRQTQLRGNSGYQKQSSNNVHPKAKAYQNRIASQEVAKPVDAPVAKVDVAPKAQTATRVETRRNEVKAVVAANANPSRGMSRAYRKARTQGKTVESAYKTKSGQSGAVARMSNPEASSRDIARTVRTERCVRGKTCGTAPSANAKRGRKNRDNSAPDKVGHSTTLNGQAVSGTQVGQGSLTGAERGACKTVSGTEYFGSEEFNTHCASTPEAGKPKVTRTQTTRGETISGTAVGNAKAVTGDRAGSCATLTGTEYLPADEAEKFCGTKPTVPAKITGFSVDSSQLDAKENGSKVTGSNSYKSQSTTLRPSEPTAAPQKVVASKTASGNKTTGTQVGRLKDVTGDERGYCSAVTGTGYQGAEETETLCDSKPVAAPAKITVSSTTRGQIVSGDRSGETTGITGAEAGTCKAITGSSYMSAEHSASCGIQAKAEIQHRTMGSVMSGKQALTGAQPGPDGLTGAEKGACELISGTPYQGAAQTAAVCGSQVAASQPGEPDFPQLINANIPAAPVSAQQMMLAPVVGMPTVVPVAVVEETPEPASRITGDGWDRGSKITGTEGHSATSRNASYGGGRTPAPVAGAHGFRPKAMPDVPQSVITGSAGNTSTGAKVTLTGGARA
ncbi:carboxysome shell protein [Thiosulfatimonas sediminis]|uniref:Carboxysome shell protein n=1 Tax=Thiosulfatimonas sediminis TaxID=2675054 RepID=A0A6F8PS19_9GAMM|nr:CsoS2 family carboxysome shell protein [Thiosulfatimonas sediminis]BBP44923.1 carboxysome shell protein [Thiosulfatimonas sediminis]